MHNKDKKKQKKQGYIKFFLLLNFKILKIGHLRNFILEIFLAAVYPRKLEFESF